MLVNENQVPMNLKSFKKGGSQEEQMQHSFPQRYAESYWQALEHFLNVIDGRYWLKGNLEINKYKKRKKKDIP